MITYIDAHRASFGVEPICRTLQVAPSSYYAAKSRPPSARRVSDATLTDVIVRVHRANFGVYGVRKVWKAIGRLGIDAGRDQIRRLMLRISLQSDHPFRSNPISRFGGFRSPAREAVSALT